MIPQRVAGLIIFALLLVLTLIALIAFIYVMLIPDFNNQEDILIGTGIGVISGTGLSLYAWRNIVNPNQ
ncbi:MAG: hypothetical protein J6Q31_01005 [Alistipes sp.]|nr:hypothetical protein [Alistipes sp.]